MNYLTLLQQGIDSWNQWRAVHPGTPCSLNGVDLSRGYFFEGNFSSVDLSDVDLSRACLIGADFSYANLSGADLSEAYLGEADFTGANLSGANLTGAHVERVEFGRAMGVSAQQLEAVAEERELSSLVAVNSSRALGAPVASVPVVSGAVAVVARPQRKQRRRTNGNVYDPGIRKAISRLRLGPQAHETKLFRMMSSMSR